MKAELRPLTLIFIHCLELVHRARTILGAGFSPNASASGQKKNRAGARFATKFLVGSAAADESFWRFQPRPLPSLAAAGLSYETLSAANDNVEMINVPYFFFFAFFVFFLATFFFAFFFAAIGMNHSVGFRPGSSESSAPQNMNTMSGLHFQMQYPCGFREIVFFQKCNKT